MFLDVLFARSLSLKKPPVRLIGAETGGCHHQNHFCCTVITIIIIFWNLSPHNSFQWFCRAKFWKCSKARPSCSNLPISLFSRSAAFYLDVKTSSYTFQNEFYACEHSSLSLSSMTPRAKVIYWPNVVKVVAKKFRFTLDYFYTHSFSVHHPPRHYYQGNCCNHDYKTWWLIIKIFNI